MSNLFAVVRRMISWLELRRFMRHHIRAVSAHGPYVVRLQDGGCLTVTDASLLTVQVRDASVATLRVGQRSVAPVPSMIGVQRHLAVCLLPSRPLRTLTITLMSFALMVVVLSAIDGVRRGLSTGNAAAVSGAPEGSTSAVVVPSTARPTPLAALGPPTPVPQDIAALLKK